MELSSITCGQPMAPRGESVPGAVAMAISLVEIQSCIPEFASGNTRTGPKLRSVLTSEPDDDYPDKM